MNIVELLTSISGRIGRAAFAAAITTLSTLATPIGLAMGVPMAWPQVSLAHQLLFIAFVFPYWALAVKRAHDLDKSAWWLLGWVIALFAAFILVGAGFISIFTPNRAATLGFALAAMVIGSAAMWQIGVKLFLFPGTPGSNDHGPPCRLLHDLLNEEVLEPEIPEPRDLQGATGSRRPVIASTAAIAAPSTLANKPRPAAKVPTGFARRNGVRPA